MYYRLALRCFVYAVTCILLTPFCAFGNKEFENPLHSTSFLQMIIAPKNDTQQHLKIGVVDVQKVIENSIAVQSLKKSISTVKESAQKELQKKELELKEIEKFLIEQKGKLSEIELKKRKDEFQQKLTNTQRISQEQKHAIEQNYAEEMQKVYNALSNVIKNIAQEREIDIVLSMVPQVLYAKQHMDLTDLVIKRLNTQITH